MSENEISEATVWVIISIVAFLVVVIGLCVSCLGIDVCNVFPDVCRGPLFDCWGCCGRRERVPEDWRDRYFEQERRVDPLPPVFLQNQQQMQGGQGQTDEENQIDDDQDELIKTPPPPPPKPVYLRADRTREDVESATNRLSQNLYV